MAAICSAIACGGGGGSGGDGQGASGSAKAISLLSITFPKQIHLKELQVKPPDSAPLSQQIVFTFSGEVAGKVTGSSILIYSDPGQDYEGPLVLLDPDKNIVTAMGSFEVLGNVVVFTPKLPKKALDLSLHADADAVPGLLPDREYVVLVPVGTSGSISNLAAVQPGVKNPVKFRTGNIESLYFSNFSESPPEVIGHHPEHGRADFPIHTLASMTGHEPFEGIWLEFDQALLPSEENLGGHDGDGDGLFEPNVFLRFSEKRLHCAAAELKGLLRLDREAPGLDLMDTMQATKHEGLEIPLEDIAFGTGGRMIGRSGDVFYQVDYKVPSSSAELEPLFESGLPALRGLAVSPDGSAYTVNHEDGMLLRIDLDSGHIQSLNQMAGDPDSAGDLAFRHDGSLFLLRTEEASAPMSYVEEIDAQTGDFIDFHAVLPGVHTSFTFVDRRTLCLFEEQERCLWTVNLDTGAAAKVGTVMNGLNGSLDLAALFHEVETTAELLSNQVDESRLSLDPKGILPMGTEVEIMVRNRLENLRGYSLSLTSPSDPALASCFVAAFTTFDPGPEALDVFEEDFLDNRFESADLELGQPPALWNCEDQDGTAPHFGHLVAAFGHGGGGEHGDFHPLGLFPLVILDTNYQPLPLFDGSTPNVTEPTAVVGGRFNFRNIVIPFGVTVTARGSNPLVLTATGDVEIAGTIDVSGKGGGHVISLDSGFTPAPGGTGGPGGGRGGRGQPPVPEKFQLLTQLQSPPTGEHGWDPSNQFRIGGRGGDTCAREAVPYKGANHDWDSRGSGGGGGSLLQTGITGQGGKGTHVPGPDGQPLYKSPPDGGAGGNPLFTDADPGNNYFGFGGEIAVLQGGQGGGGGGSRYDSLNPKAKNSTWAGMPNCMWDAKGGGGGGGGGALAIHALGEIRIAETGQIMARGGYGGGGEQVGASNYGGGGGGGSGGVVILHSGQKIILEESTDPDPEAYGAVIDVSGGMFADAREYESSVSSMPDEFCPEGKAPPSRYCTLSYGDGGQGGFGLIQLMVENPQENLVPPPSQYPDAKVKVGATIFEADQDTGSYGKSGPGYTYYERAFLTLENDPGAYPKTFAFGRMDEEPFPPYDQIVIEEPPLVDPVKTTATLAPLSYAVSKWIDLGGAALRPLVGPDPGLLPPVFLGFRGTDPLTGSVITENGYVVGALKTGWNDIVVHAPSLSKAHFIPEDNKVVVEFQGARPAAPGLSLPGDDLSPWTPDIASLSGYPLIRFRVKLNVSVSNNMSVSSPRPQVAKLRIRVQY